MRLSTRVRYACRAMVDLAIYHDEGPVTLEKLAEDTAIPPKYLAKIIQELRRSGLICSVRGAHGGYLMAGPADRVRLLDIWEALEGPVCPVECLEHPEGCDRVTECVTRDVWSDLRDAVTQVLASTTVAELARHSSRAVSSMNTDNSASSNGGSR